MFFYVVPLLSIGQSRAPAIVKSRLLTNGIDCRWSLQDFGRLSNIGVLATDIQISGALYAFDPDLTQAVTGRQRSDLLAVMRDGGVEDPWVTASANTHRELVHRLLGLSQALQSANDDLLTTPEKQNPSLWLGRFIHLGFDDLQPIDQQAFLTEQTLIRKASQVRVGDWVIEGTEWVNRVTGRRLPVIAGGALPATDTFTSASDQALTTYSANWTNNSNSFMVLGTPDTVRPNFGDECGAHWNADTFGNDQYAKGTIAALINSSYVGPAIRCHASAATYYGLYTDGRSAELFLFKMVSGTWSQIGSGSSAVSANDVLQIEATGTTITAKKNASTTGTAGAQSDSSISSGYAGICGYNTGVTTLDNWEGGNLGSAVASLVFDDRRQRFQNLIVR